MTDGPTNPDDTTPMTPGLFPIREVLPPITLVGEAPPEAEQARHLTSALDDYDTAAALHADILRFQNKNWYDEQVARLGRNVVHKWQRQKHEKYQLTRDNAMSEWLHAYGIPLTDRFDEDTVREYGDFEASFYGSSQGRIRKREALRRQLRPYFVEEFDDEASLVHSGTIVFEPEDPTRRVSLSRALRPEFAHIDLLNYRDLDPGVVRCANPAYLLRNLVDVPYGSANSRSVQTDDGSWRSTVFLPGEWTKLLRSDPRYIADAAFNGAEQRQRQLEPELRDASASYDARIAVNLSKAEIMEVYVDTELAPSLQLIARFKEAAQYNGGLARFGNEVTMRDQMDHLWGTVIRDMVWAVRIVHNDRAADSGERRWDYDDEDALLAGLEQGVYLAETPRERRERFVALILTAELWLQSRAAHIGSKVHEARNYAENLRASKTDQKVTR